MKCVHGVDLNYYCGQCVEDDRHAAHAMGTFPMDGEEDAPLSDLAASVNDRVATELASLTQAIQGLSGNVAKLVDRKPHSGYLGDLDTDQLVQELEMRGYAARKALYPQGIEVKRGPVTHDEIQTSIEAADNYSNATRIGLIAMQCALEAFAKSRGLID